VAKLYSKNTWQDEVITGDILYDISQSDDTLIYEEVKIALNADVITAGTTVNAARMNNIEEGIDALDTLMSINLTEKTTRTLTTPLILSDTDSALQFIDPGGAARDVELPAEGLDNHLFVIANVADAAETLTVKDDGGNTIGTVAQGETKIYISNGSVWRQLTTGSSSSGGGSYATILALGG